MNRYSSDNPRRGWVTVEQILPGDVVVSAWGNDVEIEISDVVAVDDPEHGRLPALRGWDGRRHIRDGRQLPGRICAYRVGDIRDTAPFPPATTWSATPAR